ncbi:hypothetical protein H5J22_00445 [Cetobacterium sp. 8H]|uniref:hypothetical protein n=1 Tax=Cetobacterium sp. 8H TaxID=2759681 RepID=UPI00163CA93C|nr:hypothetical protein [Cetobacterium sp. 8H]MBC2849928.1 hypothetical protein [Cetobacterium sp. 8H]
MSKNSYYNSGELKIKSVNYENIIEKFNIFKVKINDSLLKTEGYGNFNAKLFKAIKIIKNIKSYYYNTNKCELFILGNKKFNLEKIQLLNLVLSTPQNLCESIESLKDLNELYLLKLLSRQLPYSKFKVENSDEDIKFVNINALYFFLHTDKSKSIFKFIEVLINKSKYSNYYEIDLNQVTFSEEKYFKNTFKNGKKFKSRERINFDPVTRLMIPDENGHFIKGNPFTKDHKTFFLTEDINKISKLRSYFFTLLKNSFKKYLSEYIEIEFITLSNYKIFEPKSTMNFFEKNLKIHTQTINLYRVEDILKGKTTSKHRPDTDIEVIKNCIPNGNYPNLKIVDKGVVYLNTLIENNDWNLFILNSPNAEDLEVDGYKLIKEKLDIISQGICIDNLKDSAINIAVKRSLDELFIKEQIKNRDISKLHKLYHIFSGMGAYHLKNGKIKNIFIHDNGKISIDSCYEWEDNDLSRNFFKILNENNIKYINNKSEDIKILIIKSKTILIENTSLRPYFDTNKFKETYISNVQNGIRSISRSKYGFLKHSIGIWINEKDNMYYSFHKTGIKGTLIFSPNIKRVISKSKITSKEYELIGETLNFIYHSNTSRMSSYPFIFKLTSEL